MLYQFARGDDYYQNIHHNYIMQLNREISGFNYPPYEAGLLILKFKNLEDELNTNGKKRIFEFGNRIRIFEWNANIRISEYSLTSLFTTNVFTGRGP